MSSKELIFIAKVVDKKGLCGAGHEVGDTFEINRLKTGGICGICYPYPTLKTLEQGGRIPQHKNQAEFTYLCPDRATPLGFKITKVEQK